MYLMHKWNVTLRSSVSYRLSIFLQTIDKENPEGPQARRGSFLLLLELKSV